MSLKEKYTAHEASLKMDILVDSLAAKCYNENLHARLIRESNLIEIFGLQEEIIALYELTDMLRKKEIPWFLEGRASNLYLLYLLGISDVDPIAFNLRYEQYFGMDFEDDKVSFSQHLITLRVPQSNYFDIVSFFKTHSLLVNKSSELSMQKFSIGKISIVKSDMPSRVNNYCVDVDMSLFENFIIKEYDDDELVSAFKQIYGKSYKSEIGLYDVIKVHGLLNSEWNYEDVISAFMDLDLPISEVPMHSDDIFELFNKSMINKDAWRYTEYINQGKNFPKDVDFGLKPKILEWCNNALYLYPRANTVESFIKEYKLNRGML